MSFAHVDLGSLSRSRWQILPNSLRLEGKCLWTAIFRSLHRCYMGLSRCSGHLSAVRDLSSGHYIVLAICCGSLSCRKVSRCLTLGSQALWNRFSLHFEDLSIFGCVHLSLSSAEEPPRSVMLPPPRFTVGMVLARRWAVAWYLPDSVWSAAKRIQFFVSSDQRIISLVLSGCFKCH